MYLANDEILECYLGSDAVTEAYLGDALVFSSGPVSGLKAIPTSVLFYRGSLVKTIKVRSSESWTMTLPSWISADVTSGSAGDTDVTLTATAQVAATTGTISLSSENYSASVNVSYEEANYVDGIRMSAAPRWDAEYCLDTNVTVGGTDTTIRVKYYGGGVFSDRIVGTVAQGPEGNQGVNDDNDFRYFPTMADAGGNRISSLPTRLYANGVFQDITLGNLYVYNNQTSTMISQGDTNAPLETATIRVDMSTNWIQEVIISKGGNVVYDGKAASIGSEYGLYDTIAGGFITDSNLNIVARQAS